MIKTKLHILAENIDPATMKSGRDFPGIKKMLDSACYVIDSAVMDVLRKESAAKSLEAMIEARVIGLPHPRITMEFEIGAKIREFVYIEDKGDYHYDVLYSFMDTTNNKAGVGNHPLTLRMKDDGTFHLSGLSDWPDGIRSVMRESILFALGTSFLMLNIMGL